MIPSVLAHQVQQGVKDFLRTTFPLSTPISTGFSKASLREKTAFSWDPISPSTFHSGRGKVGRTSSPMSRHFLVLARGKGLCFEVRWKCAGEECLKA